MPRGSIDSKPRCVAEPVALLALVCDAAIGWPAWLYARIGHPVGGFARIIDGCETRWNRATRSDAVRRLGGIVTVALLVALAGGAGLAIERLLLGFGRWGWVLVALLAFPALAQRSLDDHVRPVAAALARGDLAEARVAVGRIVGRDTARLDSAAVARAGIESLAESFCDGVVAPLFWLLLLGLPGAWIYKAINTADSLIGHREPRWRAFGWAAARTDDLLNLVPARLAGVLVCLAGGGGWRTMLRDAGKHASPNAGWPEAAMASALGVRLAGPIAYDGVMQDKPWIGGAPGEAGKDNTGEADAASIARALRVYRTACLLLWLIAGIVAWRR
jgi:adenosylcobinamide-phosphate synthase